jgi:tryptophanyl-tRNA synthetase
MRSLTGIQPSGAVHIGNLLGMIQPALEYQQTHECFYFIADLHALTTLKDPELLRRQTLDCVAAWLACGMDVKRHIMYRQSDVPMVTEFAWYLSCCTGVGFLEKSHAYKDAVARGREVNHGTFAYPVLMAADILMYEADIVPVGKDQKQHVEMARDMAGAVNAVYGADVLKLPEPVIREAVMTIPGLDGRKMSKSYDNVIPVFEAEKQLRKRIMALKTDSTPLEAPKSLAGTFLGDLFKLFAAPEAVQNLERRLNQGGLGWGHAKEELFVAINERVKEPRQRYQELRSDESGLQAVLKDGAERAFAIGRPVLDRLRQAVGIGPQLRA